MDLINTIIGKINSFAWGPVMLVLLVGTGLLLSIGTKVIQYRRLGTAFKLLFKKTDGEGDISPLQSLTTSLAATIGTGNIAGVATAIALGGPGAVFWMWVTAIVGGATKFGEALLGMKYRITNEKGEKSGGPMYYASRGMEERFGGNWKWLGWSFAFFGIFAGFGMGNMVQSNSVAAALKETFNLNPVISGIVLAALVAFSVIGGIKSIGAITEKLVPFMAIVYVVGSIVILALNIEKLGWAFSMIFGYAFNASAVSGGLLGTVIRYGVARGAFSNEAGIGSAPIAHAAAKNNDPVTQGIIASLGCFLDTIIVCTMTALVILVSGLVSIDGSGTMVITDGLTGAALSTRAFGLSLPKAGTVIVSFGLILFSFSTIMGWYYYGSKCLEYIAGVRIIKVYKLLFTAIVFLGAIAKLSFVWNLSDTFNGLMIIPNVIALVALSPVIFTMLKEYEKKK